MLKVIGKQYYTLQGVGRTKYCVSFHDGKKAHKDGSPFFDLRILKNKGVLSAFIKTLKKDGYKERGLVLS